MSWQEKHETATKLIAEVKDLNAQGIADGETADKAHKMFAEAQRIGAEARAEKVEAEKADVETKNSRLTELLDAYEKNDSNTGKDLTRTATQNQGNGSAMVSVQSLNDACKAEQVQSDARKQFDGSLVRLIATDEAARRMGVKDFSPRTQTTDPDALKLLVEGTTTAGGFLVVADFAQEMFAETRRQGNALRGYGWLNEHRTNSSSVVFPRGGGAATVGIVAEGAAKPTADQTYSQVTVNMFTWAGISKVSNQLVADSDPMIADLVARELGSLLGNLEEQKVISGTGTGEPRGILATTGVVADAYTDASPTAQELIDQIINTVASFQQAYFAPPNGILLHPRRLAFLQKGKDSALNYLFNAVGTFRAPGGFADQPSSVNSVTQGTRAPVYGLLGLPIGISTNIPTNLGAGTNEDIVIVGDWNEAHWFQRQDVTLDASSVAGTAFEENETWFRLEERAGFTAERYPTAFRTIGGTGLVP